MIDKYTLKDYPRPGWLPDWTDPKAYRDHGDNAAAWAWEFLRRNPEYQADFAYYMSVPGYDTDGRKTPKFSSVTYNADAEIRYFYADPPPASPAETVGEYRQRTGIVPVQLETALLHKWGLIVLNDPALAEPVFFGTDDPLPPFELQQAPYGYVFREYIDIKRSIAMPRELPGREVIVADWPEEDDGFMRVFAFDVRLPLDGQLAAAKAMLEEARQRGDPGAITYMLGEGALDPIKETRPPAPRFGSMQEYLRVFDAVGAIGWDRQAIADGVFGDRTSKEGTATGSALKRVDRAIEQAMAYVNGEYWRLLMWAGFPKNLNKAPAE